LDAVAGHIETKHSRSMGSWDELGRQLAAFQSDGLVLAVRPLSNRLFDGYRKNALLDLAYVRLVGDLLAGAGIADDPPRDALEVVIDDYGAGALLKRAAAVWSERGLSVLITTKADRDHLAARVASVAARAARAREMGGLASESTEGRLGTGNAGDRQTLDWLRHWKRCRHPWPSFVKQSFKTVYELDGKQEVVKQPVPELRALFDAASAVAFLAGCLDVRTAKLVGPSGRGVRKLSATPEGERRAPKADFPAWDMLPLLFGGAVLDEALMLPESLETLDRLLDREQGLLSGWRVLAGPSKDADDPALVTLMRAHRAGVIELVPTAQEDPVERAVNRAGLLVTTAPKAPVLALRLVR
jgi:ribonuclease HII